MKKQSVHKGRLSVLAALSALSVTPALAGPYAPAAGVDGSTAISKDDPLIQSWASGYLGYLPGANLDAAWQTPDKALGPAEGTSTDIVSLGTGGSITLTFDDPIANGDGYDFAVFENSFSDTFLELALVEVSSDGVNFFQFDAFSLTPDPVSAFGSLDPTNIDGLAGKYRQGWGTPFDLDVFSGVAGLDINNVSYVRLLDVVGDGSMFDNSPTPNPIYDPYMTTGSAGFDLDAIAVLNSASTVVPVPASIWLFASGLLGLVSLGRKRLG